MRYWDWEYGKQELIRFGGELETVNYCLYLLLLLRLTLQLNLVPIIERQYRYWSDGQLGRPTSLDLFVNYGSPEAEHIRIFGRENNFIHNHALSLSRLEKSYEIRVDRTHFRSLNMDRRPCYANELDYSQQRCINKMTNRRIAEVLGCRLPFYENGEIV